MEAGARLGTLSFKKKSSSSSLKAPPVLAARPPGRLVAGPATVVQGLPSFAFLRACALVSVSVDF